MNFDSSTARFALTAAANQSRLLQEARTLNVRDPERASRFVQIKSEIQANALVMKTNIDLHQSLLRKIVNEIR